MPISLASPDWASAEMSLFIWKKHTSSVDGLPAIVTAPLSTETIKSFDVPLCASAAGATSVPNAVLIVASLVTAIPPNCHATVPVLVPVTVQKG